MRKKILAVSIVLAVILCLAVPFLVSATDPFIVLYSNGTYDGGLWQTSDNYEYAENNTSGIISNTNTIRVGQDNATGIYRVDRGLFAFDTASLLAEDNVQSAVLQFWVYQDTSVTNFDIMFVDGTGVNTPFATLDYVNSGDYYTLGLATENMGSIGTAGISTTTYTSVTLNAAGLARISKTGYTKIGIRSSRDMSLTAPAGDEYVAIYGGESIHPPILTVTYTVSAMAVPDEMNIGSVSVFTNYKEAGDELFVWHNTLRYAEQPELSPQWFFAVDLLSETDNIIAQTSINEWGYSPLSIYLSHAQVDASGLYWQSTCNLTMTGTALYGTPTGFDNFTYELSAGDWKGLAGVSTEFGLIDAWVKTCTTWLEDKNGVERGTYGDAGTTGEWCFDASQPAQAWFLDGIPYLDTARPNLFAMGAGGTTEGPTSTGYATGIYTSIWGAYWSGAFNDLMGDFGLGGQILLIVVAMTGIGAVGYMVRQKTNEPNITITVMAVAGVFCFALGMIPLGLLLAGVLIAGSLLVHNIFLSRT